MDPNNLKEIKAIIDLMKKHGLSVFEIEKEGFRLKLEKGPSVQAAAAMPPPVAAEPKAASSAPEAAPPGLKAIESVPLKEIVSPMVGTFYRPAGDSRLQGTRYSHSGGLFRGRRGFAACATCR